MPPTACPTCIANAPIELAWSLLDPARLDEWWDAKVRRVTPAGPLSPGQRIDFSAGPLGMFTGAFDVLEVDPGSHRLRAFIRLPFGITNDENPYDGAARACSMPHPFWVKLPAPSRVEGKTAREAPGQEVPAWPRGIAEAAPAPRGGPASRRLWSALSVQQRQCLDRRIESAAELRREIEAWEEERNDEVRRRFTTADARIKLRGLCPSVQ